MAEFFNLSKLFWFFAAPDHLLVWALLIGLIALWSGWRRLAVSLLLLDLLLWVVLLLMPLGDLLMRPLETRFPIPDLSQHQPAGVIVLGGGELAEESAYWGQPQFNGAAERIMVIPVLAARYPNLPIIFSGGSGSVLRPEYKGADAVALYLQQSGLGDRVKLERMSRNTAENAIFSAHMLGGVPAGDWLLVTSAYHMPRSVGIFRQLGWSVIPYPVDFYSLTADGRRLDPKLWQNLRDLHLAAREWIGLAAYYFTGKTDQLLPGVAHD